MHNFMKTQIAKMMKKKDQKMKKILKYLMKGEMIMMKRQVVMKNHNNQINRKIILMIKIQRMMFLKNKEKIILNKQKKFLKL